MNPFYIESIINLCYSKNLKFCVFREPTESELTFLLETADWKTEDPAFIFAPFSNASEKTCSFNTSLVLRADEIYESTLYYIASLDQGPSRSTSPHSANLSKKEYTEKLNNAIQHIRSGQFEKLVLSRKIDLPVNTNDLLGKLYLEYNYAYPNAFVYLLNDPHVGTWMGASPELLLQKKGQELTTVALAGTRTTNNNLEWGEKEKREQELVTTYISDVLKCNGIKYHQSELKSIQAAHIEHLYTDFSFTLETATGKLDKLLDQLHPTPAVCGTPKEEAMDYILQNEGYEREYYTGYLGPIDREEFSFFVNLRSMQIFPGFIRIYVGGGITADSNPDKEWDETDLKSETLLSVIRKMTKFVTQ